ncbi:multicopper oxidase family protein, partial [Staphylococcus aureus]
VAVVLLPAGGAHGAGHTGHAGHGNTSEGTREYAYPNEQRAATLGYHDHRMDFTGPQGYRGLAGLYILRDEVEDSLPLPKGEREVPLVIADRTFREDGSLYYPSLDPDLQ